MITFLKSSIPFSRVILRALILPLTILVFLFFLGCSDNPYSGKWKEVNSGDKINILEVGFDSVKSFNLRRYGTKINVEYDTKGDSILMKFSDVNSGKDKIKYPWQEISKRIPIAIIHKVFKDKNTLYLEWKGFRSPTEDIELINAKNNYTRVPPGGYAEGIYEKTDNKNTPSNTPKKDSSSIEKNVDNKILSRIVMGVGVKVGMSRNKIADITGTTATQNAFTEPYYTHRFRKPDGEVGALSVYYDSYTSEYIRVIHSNGEYEMTKEHLEEFRKLGPRKIDSKYIENDDIDKLFYLRNKNTNYEFAVTKDGGSVIEMGMSEYEKYR